MEPERMPVLAVEEVMEAGGKVVWLVNITYADSAWKLCIGLGKGGYGGSKGIGGLGAKGGKGVLGSSKVQDTVEKEEEQVNVATYNRGSGQANRTGMTGMTTICDIGATVDIT